MQNFRIKRSLGIILCVLLSATITAPWAATISRSYTPIASSYTASTYEEHYYGIVTRLTALDDYTLYVLQVCKEENIDPLEMIAILQVENPKHKESAVNINYKKVWNKKTKRYVKVEDSRDVGLFQLNSKCFPDFEWFFWQKAGETEEFNPENYRHNTRVAVRLHKSNTKQFNGSLYYAVLAYNSGSGKVSSKRVASHTVDVYWPLFKKYYAILKGAS